MSETERPLSPTESEDELEVPIDQALLEEALALDAEANLAFATAVAPTTSRVILADAVDPNRRMAQLQRYVTWSDEDLAELDAALAAQRTVDPDPSH